MAGALLAAAALLAGTGALPAAQAASAARGNGTALQLRAQRPGREPDRVRDVR